MKRLLALLLAFVTLMLLVFGSASVAIAAEGDVIDDDEPEEQTGKVVCALDTSLQERAEANGSSGIEAVIAEEAEGEPFIPDDFEKAIFGEDDRVRVKNTAKYPYSAIAYMKMRYECGCNATGSGFMIGKRFLMTASHCLVCPEHRRGVSKVTFYFGYKGKGDYLYKYNGEFTYWYGTSFPGGYTADNMNWDYAYVKFDKKVGNKTGWFGTQWGLSDAAINGEVYKLAGYRDKKLRYDYGATYPINDYLIGISADAVAGNSGCPVFTSKYYAVGIYIAESLYMDNTGTYAENIVRRLTPDLRGYLTEAGF